MKNGCPSSGVSVVYERIEDISEPELGSSIHDIGLPDILVNVLEKRNIQRLYRFQYESYKRILNGENVVISAGTGTGKTKAFPSHCQKNSRRRSVQSQSIDILPY